MDKRENSFDVSLPHRCYYMHFWNVFFLFGFTVYLSIMYVWTWRRSNVHKRTMISAKSCHEKCLSFHDSANEKKIICWNGDWWIVDESGLFRLCKCQSSLDDTFCIVDSIVLSKITHNTQNDKVRRIGRQVCSFVTLKSAIGSGNRWAPTQSYGPTSKEKTVALRTPLLFRQGSCNNKVGSNSYLHSN